MYTSSQFSLTALDPIANPPAAALVANIGGGSDSRKCLLLESAAGANCNGTYHIWGFSTTAGQWYFLKEVTLAAAYRRASIIDCEYVNSFDKLYIHSTGVVTPTHWRLAIGSNGGGF